MQLRSNLCRCGTAIVASFLSSLLSFSSSMKFTCLSKGGGFYLPPCHIIDICGFRILLDCPVDLSALAIFSPLSSGLNNRDDDFSTHKECSSFNGEYAAHKVPKGEKALDVGMLIYAEPWYKTVTNLHLWSLTSIDIVLISSPMGMLGLPFLTQMKQFSAKIYVTEATAKLGKIMMEELVSMHLEFRQFYGSEYEDLSLWMKEEKLNLLPSGLRELVIGNDGSELGGWLTLYSAADVQDCLTKVQTLRYSEETCYNGIMIIKAFSSGLEIGTCNWTIHSLKRNIAVISSSIFFSAHAMNFDYSSLQGNDTIIYSDFTGLLFKEDVVNKMEDLTSALHSQLSRSLEELSSSLCEMDESIEETEKIAFISCCAIDSVKAGGSVLVPINRIGITLLLIEEMSTLLEASNEKVPIYLISSLAEELLALTNVIPEWLSKQRQAKLFSGESMFSHVELLKQKKLHVFPDIHAPQLLKNWQEPCIVFCPHWSLRLGPAVHLLRRWCGDPNSLLVLEKRLDAELALLPFRPMAMKVLQCTFLSGIKLQKVEPLLKFLQPKVVLLPEDLKWPIISDSNSFSIFPYSQSETIRIPSTKNSPKLDISIDLASKFNWRKVGENSNITRLSGSLLLDKGRHILVSENMEKGLTKRSFLHWGHPDVGKLLNVLLEMGIEAALEQEMVDFESEKVSIIRLLHPNNGVIEIRESSTIISAPDESLSALIFCAVEKIVSGV